MKEVLTYKDLVQLKADQAFPEQFLNYVEREWQDLYEVYSNGEQLTEFSLAEHDKQVLLESGDQFPGDIARLEYVEQIRLGGLQMYRMYKMETEDQGILYYSIVGTLEEETERKLKEQADWNER